MGGVKTCRKIMRDEWEYETPDRCKWPAKGKIINRAGKEFTLDSYKYGIYHIKVPY